MEWFKLYHGAIYDKKFKAIASKLDTGLCNVAICFVALLDHASQEGERRGYVGNAEPEDLAASLDLDETLVTQIIDGFTRRKMIDDRGYLTNWEKRNKPNTSTERVKRWRQRQKEKGNGGNVSQPTKRQEEKRVESPQTPQGGPDPVLISRLKGFVRTEYWDDSWPHPHPETPEKAAARLEAMGIEVPPPVEIATSPTPDSPEPASEPEPEAQPEPEPETEPVVGGAADSVSMEIPAFLKRDQPPQEEEANGNV